MKKLLIIAVTVGVLAVLGGAGLAYAQEVTPEPGEGDQTWMPGQGGAFGRGMRGPHAGQGFGLLATEGEEGPLHDLMTAELAVALGLTPEEFLTRAEAGQSFMQIGLEQGFSFEELRQLMFQTRERAMTQAAEQGLIDPEQLQWMQRNRGQQPLDGEAPGPGGPHGPGGPFGPGANYDPDECPMDGSQGPQGPGGRGRRGA